MRKPGIIAVLCLLLLFTSAFAQSLQPEKVCQVILYTYYLQMGWGDRLQIGCVDSDGYVWVLTGYESELNWPYDRTGQLSYLTDSATFQCKGKFEHDDLFALQSLILGVEDQGNQMSSGANDAGAEYSFAVQYASDGTAVPVLLGASGDDVFENTDPDAQALYLALRRLFPEVYSYAYSMNIGPLGFPQVSIIEFCGWEGIEVQNAVVSAAVEDCEEGWIAVDLEEAAQKQVIDLIQNGKVTGKANNLFTTGGGTLYTLYDSSGALLMSFELYEGMLVRNDGMYDLSIE